MKPIEATEKRKVCLYYRVGLDRKEEPTKTNQEVADELLRKHRVERTCRMWSK